MFQGNTIEELISSVMRAEEHARQQEKTAALERQYPMRRMEWPQELVEVA
jgi:hypothetical protein